MHDAFRVDEPTIGPGSIRVVEAFDHVECAHSQASFKQCRTTKTRTVSTFLFVVVGSLDPCLICWSMLPESLLSSLPAPLLRTHSHFLPRREAPSLSHVERNLASSTSSV